MPAVAFDTETHLVQPGLLTPPLVCVSVALPVEGVEALYLADDGCEKIRGYLESDHILVGANIAYDFGVLVTHDPALLPLVFKAYDEGRVYDVLIAQTLAAIADGLLGEHSERFSLEFCVKLMLGRTNAKENDYWRLRYAVLENVPISEWPAEAKQYPLDDARNTMDVALAQLDKANAGEFRNLHQMKEQAGAAWALHLASAWGFRTDAAAVTELEKRYQGEIEAAIKKFSGSGLIKPDGKTDNTKLKIAVARAYGASGQCERCGGSGKVRSEVSGSPIICKGNLGGCDGTGLDTQGLPGLPRTATGGISADRDTLEESGDDLLEGFAGVSKSKKIIQTYVPYLRGGTQYPITPRANVLVASGRTSYDGLIQLFPRSGGVRECIVARPGYVFGSVDFGAQELVTLAQCLLWICGQSRLADALNDDLDPHTAFAASMLGEPYESVLARVQAGDKEAKGKRQAAKPCNFGFPGGMGVAKFVLLNRKVGIRFCKLLENAPICGVEKITTYHKRPTPPLCKRCVELAEGLKEHWFFQWPEMRTYFNVITTLLDTTSEIEQFISKRIRGGLDFCNACNTLFQGLASEITKAALYAVQREAYLDPLSPLAGTRMIAALHDELFFETPEEKAAEASQRVADIMIEEAKRYVPDVKMKAAPALMRRWYKDADAVFDENGRLIPWEPKKKEAA